MRSPGTSLVIAGVWLTLLVGLLTNLVTDEFPPFLEPARPWLLPMLVVAGGALTFVQLGKGGPRRRLGDGSPTRKDRADALARVRRRMDTLLSDTLGGEDPLVLTVEGADSLDAAYQADESVMVLGGAGSGKSTELLRLADVLTRRAVDKDVEPLPVVVSLAGWGRRRRRLRVLDLLPRKAQKPRVLRFLDARRPEEPEPLLDWLCARAFDLDRIAPAHASEWLGTHGAVLLLDGLDEVRPELRARCVRELNDLIDDDRKPFVVVACRTAEYQALPEKPHLRRTVTVAPLSQEEVSRYLGVPLDDELRKVVDAPLWLRLAKAVSSRLDTDAGPDELRRHLLDAYVTELLDRRGGERVRLLRRLGLLIRMTRHSNDPERVDPRVLTGRDTPVVAELVAALRAWVVPPALAGALVTGLVLPLVLLFGIEVGVAGTVFAGLAAFVLGRLSDASYAVDPVAGRPWRCLFGVVAGLATGVVVGGLCALASTTLAALPGGGRTVALGALAGVAVAVFGDRPRLGGGLAAAAAVAGGMWWMDLTDPDFQGVLLVVAVGLVGCMAIALLALHGEARQAAVSAPAWRTSLGALAATAVLAAGVLVAAGVAGAPVAGPVGAAIGGFVVSVLGSAVATVLGGKLATVLVPFVRRAGLVWTGLLPVRLRPLLHEVARRGLVNATGDGFRFLHGLLRDHLVRIDVLDGRPFQPVPASDASTRKTALARLDALLATLPRPRLWIPLRLRRTEDGEPVTAVWELAAAGGTVALLSRVGAGTSTILLDAAKALLAQARADPRRPVPLYLDLGTIPTRIAPVPGVVRPFTRWVVAQARARYGIDTETTLAWLTDHRLVLLLDGHGQGRHATRTAAMVEEFRQVYDVATVVAGWADGPPPPHGSTVVTVERLTRDDVEPVLAGHPRALAFVGEQGWAALDTVDRVRLAVEAAAATDPEKSYVDGRFAGLPAAARSWYAGLTGKAGDVTEAALRVGVLVPALMVAVTLAFGLDRSTGIAAGLVTGVLARPPLIGPVRRIIGLAVAVAAGFALSWFARDFSYEGVEFADITATDTGLAVGIVLGFCVALLFESRLVPGTATLELLPLGFAAMLYLMFDGPDRFGTVWQTVIGVGLGTYMGMMLSVVPFFTLFAVSRLVGLWTGFRPWRRRRVLRELTARRLVVRTPDGARAADPLVERALPAPRP